MKQNTIQMVSNYSPTQTILIQGPRFKDDKLKSVSLSPLFDLSSSEFNLIVL